MIHQYWEHLNNIPLWNIMTENKISTPERCQITHLGLFDTFSHSFYYIYIIWHLFTFILLYLHYLTPFHIHFTIFTLFDTFSHSFYYIYIIWHLFTFILLYLHYLTPFHIHFTIFTLLCHYFSRVFCMQSFQKWIIFKQVYLTHRWNPNTSIWPIDGTLTDLFDP